MPTKFLESLGSKLAERWLATFLTPAFLFWLGGIGAWIYRNDWLTLETWFSKQSQTFQIAILSCALLTVLISAILVQSCEVKVLRFLEGYWPRWLRKLYKRMSNLEKRKEKLVQKFNDITDLLEQKKQAKEPITPDEREEQAFLENSLHYLPNNLMPTRLGNILRASEERPYFQYGLDTFICWPRLWLLLPDSVKTELTEARTNLNIGARIWLWSILFTLWTPLALWALPLGILSAYLAYRWLLDAATIYGDLLESAFDLYRIELYKATRWPLPNSPEEERQLGTKLSDYLRKRPGISIAFQSSEDGTRLGDGRSAKFPIITEGEPSIRFANIFDEILQKTLDKND